MQGLPQAGLESRSRLVPFNVFNQLSIDVIAIKILNVNVVMTVVAALWIVLCQRFSVLY